MNKLMKFNPVFRNNDLFNLMDDFFSNNLTSWNNGMNMLSQPKVNIKEDENSYTMEIAAPGLKKQDFNVSVENDHLVVSAKVSSEDKEETENYTRREFNYSSFERRYYLPETVDANKIEAKYLDGVLHLSIPKVEEVKPETKRIDIG